MIFDNKKNNRNKKNYLGASFDKKSIKVGLFLVCIVLLSNQCMKDEFVAQDCSGGGSACITSYLISEILATPPTPTYPIIFLTTNTAAGNFTSPSGPLGADQFCTANLPSGLSGTFKAFISGSNTFPAANTRKASTSADAGDGQVDWVLKSNQKYQRVDGTIIGTTNAQKLFTFPLTNSFADSGSFWSGLNTVWTQGTACVATGGSWDSVAGGQQGTIGNAGSVTSTSISNGTDTCSNPKSVLCVEQ